jgi:nickel-dependent lactate racemase
VNKVHLSLGGGTLALELPYDAEVLTMGEAKALGSPAEAVEHSLNNPIDSPPLSSLIRDRLRHRPKSRAVVVVSDHTRPVPYRGEGGILWPIVRRLLEAGVDRRNLLVLVATGTHAPMTEEQLKSFLDSRVFELGIQVKNHDARDTSRLVSIGTTSSGNEIVIDRDYLEADIRILTGLVESHFIAGVSGGRKSICPGLVGEEMTHTFHSAEMLASEQARDMNLEGNPCHDQALEVARIAGADFIVNVTLDKNYRTTGVFSGNLETAHLRAYEFLKSYVSIPIESEYDIVVTHGGFVGINHYQTVKAGLAALPAIRKGGILIIVAANTDVDPIGSSRYRTLLHLLRLVGHERFVRLIFSPDWSFIPEQWEVQAWAKILARVGPDNLLYYSPQLTAEHYSFIPGSDANTYLPPHLRYSPKLENIPLAAAGAVAAAVEEHQRAESRPCRLAVLADGPYGIVARRLAGHSKVETREHAKGILPSS